MAEDSQDLGIVPDSVIPHGALPALRYRDLPEPLPVRRMVGPSIILAGLALGSGEFIFWPKLTVLGGFDFFWACLLSVATQYFINMEITRWSLATGESAITGFCRLNRHWSWVFLICNIVPWMIPAWAMGSSQLLSWLVWGAELKGDVVASPYITQIAIASLFLCGIVLTAGPVVYETVEKAQMALVAGILVIVVVLAAFVVRADAVWAMLDGTLRFGWPELKGDVTLAALLGAIAFAGVGGTLNLGQSNYVKEKGYGMGRYIGRITSPITGKEEPVTEIGYHFPPTPENLARWRQWWRAASLEHFCSFFLTCLVCLVLLTLISYSLFYGDDGQPASDAALYSKDMTFVLGEALKLESLLGVAAKVLFLLMGVAILFTTEIGVLDAASRISMDIVKVNWLRENQTWSESRVYYAFLWGSIAIGTVFLAIGPDAVKGRFFLFQLTASLNGAVMFLYCLTLLYLNLTALPRGIRMSGWRMAILIWAVAFFGYFTARLAGAELGALIGS